MSRVIVELQGSGAIREHLGASRDGIGGRRRAAVLALVAFVVGACGGPGGARDERDVTVLAAASLKGPFTELASRYERAHPGRHVTLSFGGSSDLAAQVVEGAPADVFASADERTMRRVVDAGLLPAMPRPFARNRLTIVVAHGNPKGVRGLRDLARPGLTVVTCAPQVPCGAAAASVAVAARVTLHPVSQESKVTDVLAKVGAGEADAGLVYETDARAARGRVDAVPFPETSRAINDYPIAAFHGPGDETAARQFVDLVRSPEGQRVLRDAGFLPAP